MGDDGPAVVKRWASNCGLIVPRMGAHLLLPRKTVIPVRYGLIIPRKQRNGMT